MSEPKRACALTLRPSSRFRTPPKSVRAPRMQRGGGRQGLGLLVSYNESRCCVLIHVELNEGHGLVPYAEQADRGGSVGLPDSQDSEFPSIWRENLRIDPQDCIGRKPKSGFLRHEDGPNKSISNPGNMLCRSTIVPGYDTSITSCNALIGTEPESESFLGQRFTAIQHRTEREERYSGKQTCAPSGEPGVSLHVCRHFHAPVLSLTQVHAPEPDVLHRVSRLYCRREQIAPAGSQVLRSRLGLQGIPCQWRVRTTARTQGGPPGS